MPDCPTDPTHPSYGQGSNTHSLSPTCNFEVGDFLPFRPEREIMYQHIRVVCPITHQFSKSIGMIPRVYTLPYLQRKKKTTPTGVIVSFVEEAIFTTLQELAK